MSHSSAACLTNIEDYKDYDTYLLQSVIDTVGCVPPFWVYSYSSTLYDECVTPQKLREVNDVISILHKNNFQQTSSKYQQPVILEPTCIDMSNSIEIDWNDFSNLPKNEFVMSIHYPDEYYQEITEVKDFSFQDFVSNLGGFIGIFLGYSMMQIPELLCK